MYFLQAIGNAYNTARRWRAGWHHKPARNDQVVLKASSDAKKTTWVQGHSRSSNCYQSKRHTWLPICG